MINSDQTDASKTEWAQIEASSFKLTEQNEQLYLMIATYIDCFHNQQEFWPVFIDIWQLTHFF